MMTKEIALKYFVLLCILAATNTIFAQQLVQAVIDFNAQRAVEGVSEFDRDVFINLHGGAGESDWVPSELEDLKNRLGVNFGRSVGGVTWQMNRLRENPDRPGFFDLNHMKELGQGGKSWYSGRTVLHPYESESFVLTSHISPLFPNGKATNQGWKPANYSAVGQFYAYLLKEYYGDKGEPRPRYLEVINEPFVHANELGTTNTEISKFHNVVADSVRAHNPDVLVGGFTAAWPEFERNNFGVWDDSWKTFIDIAGANMDFYSFHIYGNPNPNNPTTRKGGNTEAIFDMIEQYSLIKTGEMKPVVISEYGNCCADWDGPYYEERDWLQLKILSSLTMSFMERPHQILKAVPFITGKATWYSNNTGYPYPHVILKPAEDGTWEYTHLAKYYELWSDVNGNRVGSTSDDIDLQIDAYVADTKAYIILNNLDNEEKTIDLSVFERRSTPFVQTRIKHLYQENDIPVFSDDTQTNRPSSVKLGAEAAMIIEYTYANPLVLDRNQQEQKYFTDTYLKKIFPNSDNNFTIGDVSTGEFGKATLRVSLGRKHGRSLQPKVTFNGTTLEVPTDWRGDDQTNRNDFFGIIEIPVPYDLVKVTNDITIRFTDSGGHIGTVVLDVNNYDYDLDNSIVGVKEPAFANEFEVFPNPSKETVYFKWTNNLEITDLKIVNINGKEEQRVTVTNQLTSAEVSQLPRGVYWIQVQTREGRFSRKIVLL